jgi:hypothetical protein
MTLCTLLVSILKSISDIESMFQLAIPDYFYIL